MFYSSNEPTLTYSAIELHLIDNYCKKKHSKVNTFINETNSSITYPWKVKVYNQNYKLEFTVSIESNRPIKLECFLLDLKSEHEEYGYHQVCCWQDYVESAIALYLLENKITNEAPLKWARYLKSINRGK
jgi:hypothetical protein